MGKDNVVLMRHFRNLNGLSHPFLAEASDKHWYVVKHYRRQAGSNLPFNECAGSELYRACDLAVPEWTPVLITDTFLDENPEAWPEGPDGDTRPQAGLAFGSRFLGESGVQLLEILPGTSFARVTNRASFWLAWLIDICAQHADNRQVVFEQSSDHQLRAVFVDHGHVFGGPKGDLTPPFIASRYLDERIYHDVLNRDIAALLSAAKALNLDQLWQRVNAIPEEWKTAGALAAFADCLNRLENTNLLRSTVDKMMDAISRGPRSERSSCCTGQVSKTEVLYLGILADQPGF